MSPDDFDKSFPQYPSWEEIPDEFKDPRNERHQFVAGWFFKGVDNFTLVAKPGTDLRTSVRVIKRLLNNRFLNHDHKMALAAYMLDEFCA